ncbi:MAG: hypothetical protein ACK6AT_15330 [Planctomycetota bacterium]|jgi:uncharacterized protein YyaL (SSP411 family)
MKQSLVQLKRNTETAAKDFIQKLRWGGDFGKPTTPSDPVEHIIHAAQWTCRAQDSGSDRGVSYGVKLGQGFMDSYPETTGYIIPTFLLLADFFKDDSYLQRAIEMGDWEIAIQMKSGAVMGGRVNSNPSPAVFNTGQVLLGWAALFERTGEERFLKAATRASNWLMEVQGQDGNWFEGNSRFALPTMTVYNVKAAWGLCAAGKAGVGQHAIDAACKNADYCLSQQLENGWFKNCCLTNADAPLLHTIAYSMQGLMGIGQIVGNSRYIQGAEKTANSLIKLMDSDGFIPGRIDKNFQGKVRWCCLTGTAQTSIVWSELYRISGDTKWAKARTLANQYLMQRHFVSHNNDTLRGGVFGSWPIWGDYGKWMILNWATKFFIDAMVLEFGKRA